MKRLCKNISAISLISLVWASSAIAAGPVVRMDKIEGKVFSNCNGVMKTLRTGDHVADFCEIITEVGAQASYSDFYDHRFHLSGSGHIKLFNKMSELKSGYIWIQAPVDQGEYLLQTANAVASFSYGEFIASFEPGVGKTQLLNVRGKSEFSNSLDRMMNISMIEGNFSFIQNEENEGYPRSPTPIGFASYKKITSLFTGVEPLDGRAGEEFKSKEEAQRAVASVEVEVPQVAESKVTPAGEIIIIRKLDEAAQKKKSEELMQVYQQKVTGLLKDAKPKKFVPDYSTKSGVKMRIFSSKSKGSNTTWKSKPNPVQKTATVKKVVPNIEESTRAPASVGDMAPQVNGHEEFQEGVLKQYKNQMRHSQEVNNLIDRLKSVEMDYQKDY